MRRILVLGAGGAAANSFTRALDMTGGYETHGTNCDPYGLTMAETNHVYRLPHATEPDYRRDLLALAEKIKPDLVHAQNDEEVAQLSLLRYKLPVFLPSNLTIRVCHNKWYSHCSWRGHLPQPDTQLILFPSDLEKMFRKERTLWLRNIRGAGGNGSIATDDPALAKAWIDHHNGWGQFTAAEVLERQTATYTAIYHDGEFVVGQGRRRHTWGYSRNQPSGVSGITGVGSTWSSVDFSAHCRKAIRAIDPHPHGLYGVDCAQNGIGEWCPTEINIGRFHTTVPEFFARAGLNVADIYCRKFFGEEYPEPIQLRPGIEWVRLMDKEPVLL